MEAMNLMRFARDLLSAGVGNLLDPPVRGIFTD